MSDTTECLPPPGTLDGSWHTLSAEVGDGTSREPFRAQWKDGLWVAPGIFGLSPRKAAWVTWEYVSPAPKDPTP